MELIINQQVIERLTKEGFYPDNMMSALFALQSLETEPILLDVWDDFNKSRRAIVLYYDLVDKGLWERDIASAVHFKATPKGQKLLTDIKILTGQQGVKDWIQQYINLFPEGVAPGGKLLRSDAKTCESKMNAFIKKYKFSPATILKATKDYLEGREATNWAYTKAAVYFIDKRGEGSELAARCLEVEKQKDKPKQESQKQVFI